MPAKTERTKQGIRYYQVVGAVAGLAAVATFLLGPKQNQELRAWLVAAWMIVPPLFFFAEHCLVRRYRPTEYLSMHEDQEAARHIWAGIAAALALLFLKNP